MDHLRPAQGHDLLARLASLPAAERDAEVERCLGMMDAPSTAPPGEHLVGHHASGVAPIVRALLETPVTAADVLVDLGAGLGKVVMLTRLLTGARAVGIELQPELVRRARDAASRLGLEGVTFVEGDAREAALDDGTVFFLYVPFTGPVLARVMDRLRVVASRRAIVVCALGVEVDREASWLVRRPVDAFWLTIYDSAVPGALRRPFPPPSSALGTAADVVAFERAPATR